MGSKVELYIYDLTGGMARQFGSMLAPGLQLDGVWHTAIVCFNTEWFYGGGGIEQCSPGGTMMGRPLKVEQLGETRLSRVEFQTYLTQLESDRFAGHRYDLFRHNCNNFSNEVALHLCNKQIPQYILDLPNMVLNSPLAQMLAPIIQQATPHGSHIGGSAPPSASIPSAQPTRHFEVNEVYPITFKAAIDNERLMGKLMEVDEKYDEKLIKNNFDVVFELMSKPLPLSIETWTVICSILMKWKSEDVFPILDILRWNLSKSAPVNTEIAKAVFDLLINSFLTSKGDDKARFLSLRVLVNFFAWEATKAILVESREKLIDSCNKLVEELEDLSAQTQVGIATIAMDYAAHLHRHPDPEAAVQIVSAVFTSYLSRLKNPEAVYRVIVATGVILKSDEEAKDFALALEGDAVLDAVPNLSEKVAECAKQCKALLASK